MASNDDLDNFFKKKDRKSHKPNKPTGLLTNNEELLKQLVIVTSATTAFKENLDLVDDEDDPFVGDEPVAPVVDQPVVPPVPSKISHPPKIKAHEDNADRSNNVQQQDEWEEFEESNPKYEELRSKFLRANRNDDDDDDDRSDNSMTHDENNHPHDERDQHKDKPVWKLDQLKSNENPAPEQPAVKEENVRPPSPVKVATTGVYRPPQMRSGAAVAVVSGSAPRPSKKKQPNIASTEEFPTLGAAVNKK